MTPTLSTSALDWQTLHVKDHRYAERRAEAVRQVQGARLSDEQMRKQLLYSAQNNPRTAPDQRRQDEEVARKLLSDFFDDPMIPHSTKDWLRKSVLDTSGGAPLIRQDLDPTLHALYVQKFPAWDRVKKVPANGLVHAYNVMTDPASGAALGASIISDLSAVTFYETAYSRKTTANVAEFAIGRGVGLKQLGAVQAGGMPYNVTAQELANGMTQLARDAQYTLLAGNASNSGGTAANEGGPYNVNAFDGLRGILGSYASAFTGNGAIQLDQGSLNLYQSIKNVGAQGASAGGVPTAAFMTYGAKEALDLELMPQQRYQGGALQEVEIIPGVKTTAIPYVGGLLTIIPVPGTTFGSYTDPVTGTPVEDVYVVDEDKLELAWLFSEGWTVLELPVGYSNDLSARYIVFGLWTLAVIAPLFDGKVRRPLN